MVSNDVRDVVREAVGRLAPEEMSYFDEVWDVYLNDPRDCADLLRSRDTPLGSGLEILVAATTPLLASVAGEALASWTKGSAEQLGRKLGRWFTFGRARRAREERRAALEGAAPDPTTLEHAVMRALFLDIMRKANVPDDRAASVADTLADVFTEQPGGQPRPGAAAGSS
jgi:hypothetical protein